MNGMKNGNELWGTPQVSRVANVWAVALVATLISGFFTSGAFADFIGPAITVEARTAEGSVQHTFPILDRLPDRASEKAVFVLTEKFPLVIPGQGVVGEVENLEVELDGDPAVDLIFAVSAGNSDVSFTISSAVVAFAALDNPQAQASAAVTLTDGSTIPVNGADLDVPAGESSLYHATYNGGTSFADLLSSLSISEGSGSASAGTGITVINDSVTSIAASFTFDLTAEDSASGTSRFEVFVPDPDIPEPTTALISMWLIPLVVSSSVRAVRQQA